MKRFVPFAVLLASCAALGACFGRDSSRFAQLPSDSIPLVLDSTDLMILNADSSMQLGVVGTKVVMRVSPQLRAMIQHSMDTTTSTGIGGTIARAVMGKMSSMMNHRLEYDLADIDSVNYTGDRLDFVYRNRHAMTFDDFKSGHESVLRTFKTEDAMHFVEVFRAHKSQATPPS